MKEGSSANLAADLLDAAVVVVGIAVVAAAAVAACCIRKAA